MAACVGGKKSGWGSTLTSLPSFVGSDTISYTIGLPFTVASSGVRGLLSTSAFILQNVAGFLDKQVVEDAMLKSLGETGRLGLGGTGLQFKEIVKVDKVAKKYGLDIVFGTQIKPECLKISRRDNIVTIDIKTEKSTLDGSSRLYQEFSKKIAFPVNVDLNQLESVLTPAGVLSIKVPFIPVPEEVPQVPVQPMIIPVSTESNIIE